MATITAREHGAPQVLTAASWRALVAAFLGWMFDGYETYALILVAAVALRQLLAPDQLASLPIYIGSLLAVTLIGWATGGIIAGILADYIGRKRMLMLSMLWIRTSVQDPDLWIAARERRRQARERVASGRAVRPEDRALAGFTVKQILASPDLRRRLLLLLMLSLSTIVAWWAVSTWIPFYAGQIAARAGGNAQRAGALAGLYYNVGGILGYFVFGVLADAWGRKPTMVLYYAGAVVLVLMLFRV